MQMVLEQHEDPHGTLKLPPEADSNLIEKNWDKINNLRNKTEANV